MRNLPKIKLGYKEILRFVWAEKDYETLYKKIKTYNAKRRSAPGQGYGKVAVKTETEWVLSVAFYWETAAIKALIAELKRYHSYPAGQFTLKGSYPPVHPHDDDETRFAYIKNDYTALSKILANKRLGRRTDQFAIQHFRFALYCESDQAENVIALIDKHHPPT